MDSFISMEFTFVVFISEMSMYCAELEMIFNGSSITITTDKLRDRLTFMKGQGQITIFSKVR